MVFRNFSFTGMKVIKPIEQSPDHDGFSERLPQVLMLADRILVACAGTAVSGGLPRRLEKAFTSLKTHETTGEAAHDFLADCQEPFLREVLRYGLPEVYGKLKSRGNNLFGIIVNLEMLTKGEADRKIEEANLFIDPVRKAAFGAKEERNPTSHTAPIPYFAESYQSIDDVLITILAAVDRHRDALRTNLEGLFVRSLEAGGQLPMLRMVEGERSKHLRLFKGRSTLISDISSRADKIRSGGGYILITGPEGFGKSALASKLSEEFGRNVKIIGAFADATRRDCPWLPGILLHLGKQGRDEDDIVQSLIDQANTCLLSKVTPPPRPKSNAEIDLDASIFDSDSSNDDESRSGRTRRISLSAGTRTNHAEVLRRALYLTLEQLAFEQGHVTFIVDSLDEISPNGAGLEFLPSPLPKNVVGVLTARNETKLVEALKQRLRPYEVQLSGLDVADVAAISGESNPELNQNLRDSTVGSPLHVQNVVDLAKEQGGLSKVDIPSAAKDVFERQKRAWQSPGIPEDKDPLYALLCFLSALERTGPIPLSAAQNYLRSVGFPRSLNQVKELLTPVSSQIASLEAGQVGIGVKPFSEFVLGKVLSSRDLEALLEQIAKWLADDGDFGEPDAFIDPELRARFLLHWADSTSTATPRQRVAAGHLLTRLTDSKQYESLCRLVVAKATGEGYIGLRKELGIFARAAELAAEGNHPQGLRLYSSVLLSRPATGDDSTERGIQMLERAADGGSIRAMWQLGERLIDGKGVAANPTKGEAFLRKAVDAGNSFAMQKLGERLINGKRLTANPAEGEALLRRSVDAGNSIAMRELGGRLIDGNGLTANPTEGESFLQRAIDAGDSIAMRQLGGRLIDGNGLAANPTEGESLLQRAADAGSSEAMNALAFFKYQSADGKSSAAAIQLRSNAVKLFARAFQLGDLKAGINATYILRRGESSPDGLPSVVDLLAPGLAELDSFALVNDALCHASGFQRPIDWVAADARMAEIGVTGAGNILEWWHKLAQQGDAEGDLILGWLARHGLIKDPDAQTIETRLNAATAGGWQVPKWLFHGGSDTTPLPAL